MRSPHIRSPRLTFKSPVLVHIGEGHEAHMTNLSLEGCRLLSQDWFAVSTSNLKLRLQLPYSSATLVQGQVTNANIVNDQKLGRVYQLGIQFDQTDPRFHEFETWLIRAARAQKEHRLRIFESQDDVQAAALLMQIRLKNALEAEEKRR